MKIGITFKINLILLLVVFFLGAAMGAFFIIENQNTFNSTLERRIQLVGNGISKSIGEAAAHEDTASIERFLNAFVLDDEISYIMVKSGDGQVLAARWTRETRGSVAEYSFPLHANVNGHGNGTFGEASQPAAIHNTGQLTIGVDLSFLQESRNRLLKKTLLTVTAGSLLALLIGFVATRLFLRRSLSPLLEQINRVGAGDLSGRVTVSANDEISLIGTAFNDMTDRLSRTLVSKQELETAVEQRTADLQALLLRQLEDQRALAEQETHIRLLLNSTAEAIHGLDRDGNCTFCNPACVQILGYDSSDELIGRNMHDLIHHSNPDGTPMPQSDCRMFAALADQSLYHTPNVVLWRKDGTCFHAELWSHPIIRSGVMVGAVVTFIDITERIRIEEQLIHSQKLEGIGVLAGGIAHDFNNLLTPIIGYAEMGLLKIEEGNQLQKMLQVILDCATRGADLTRQILAFSRKQVLEMKILDLNGEVSTFEQMLSRLIGEDIQVRLDLDEQLPRINADAGQVRQILLNLTVNARDAMPEGGTLSIETGTVQMDGDTAWNTRNLVPGTYVFLAVSDTGTGIDEETRQKVFEPFFTTKEKGKGTGLGLSTVYGIAKQHGGEVSVYSELARGTTFKVYFPCGTGTEHTAPAPLLPMDRGKPSRILLIEDEEPVRAFIHEALLTAGHRVTCCSCGAEALAAAREEHFDLAVSDVVMPDLNGPEVYEKLVGMLPGLKVLYISGYPARSGALKDLFEEDAPLLHKPFTAATLLGKIAQLTADLP